MVARHPSRLPFSTDPAFRFWRVLWTQLRDQGDRRFSPHLRAVTSSSTLSLQGFDDLLWKASLNLTWLSVEVCPFYCSTLFPELSLHSRRHCRLRLSLVVCLRSTSLHWSLLSSGLCLSLLQSSLLRLDCLLRDRCRPCIRLLSILSLLRGMTLHSPRLFFVVLFEPSLVPVCHKRLGLFWHKHRVVYSSPYRAIGSGERADRESPESKPCSTSLTSHQSVRIPFLWIAELLQTSCLTNPVLSSNNRSVYVLGT